MKIGIDKIAFYAPSYYISLEDLANARGIDPNKYLIGLGQRNTAIIESNQDVVTLAANAAIQIIAEEDLQKIDLVLFASESSIDESKAAGLYLKPILKLKSQCRIVELKQACYSSAIALQFALNHVQMYRESKVLILASDIAKYGTQTAGEPTQGAGAVAMLISQDPKIMEIHQNASYISEDVNDFFRPTNHAVPIVDGKLSTETYLRFFQTVYNEYTEKTKMEYDAICFHMPFAKLGYKALTSATQDENLLNRYSISKYYNQDIGNIYTGSLFLSLISLLENDLTLKSNDTIGFFAYGSGATGEFFSGRLQENYQQYLNKENHEKIVQTRHQLTISQYESLYNQQQQFQNVHQNVFVLENIENGIRTYKKV